MKATRKNEQRIMERLTELEQRLLSEVRKHLGNIRNSSSSDPTELLDMVSEGEMDYMAAVSAQSGSATLDDIERALEKLKEGTYGVCEDCGEDISERRLDVRPFAVLCVRCKEQRERQSMPGRAAVSSRGTSEVNISLTDEDSDSGPSTASDVLRDMDEMENSEIY